MKTIDLVDHRLLHVRIPSCGAVVLLVLSLVSTAHAHPYHHSYGEAEWNASHHCLEIAIKVLPNDLEAAVQRHFDDQQLRLEGTDVESKIAEYVRASFRVGADAGSTSKLTWIGMEINVKEAWLYFEVPLASSPVPGVLISHRLLLTTVPGQTNFLTMRVGDHSETLAFTAKKPAQVWAGEAADQLD